MNISPSMASSSPLDSEIKGALLRDVFNAAGYLLPPRRGPVDATPWRGRPLTPEEKTKHALFVTTAGEFLAAGQLPRILAELTDDDVAMLLDSEDERVRAGPAFTRVFPGTDPQYLLYTEAPRYYNLLLTAWAQHWATAPEQGSHRWRASRGGENKTMAPDLSFHGHLCCAGTAFLQAVAQAATERQREADGGSGAPAARARSASSAVAAPARPRPAMGLPTSFVVPNQFYRCPPLPAKPRRASSAALPA